MIGRTVKAACSALPLGSREEHDEREEAASRTHPVAARCVTCGHTWTVCYLPMPMERAAHLMQAAACPKGCTAGPKLGSIA